MNSHIWNEFLNIEFDANFTDLLTEPGVPNGLHRMACFRYFLTGSFYCAVFPLLFPLNMASSYQ